MALTSYTLKQDRNIRKTAVPFRGSIWGMTYQDGTERNLQASNNVPGGTGYGDIALNNLLFAGSSTAATVNPVRILQPMYGTIVSCFLDISMSFGASDAGIGYYFAIGTFSNQTAFTVQSSYSQTFLNTSWTKINGGSAPITVAGTTAAPQTFNLLPAMYPSGDPNFIPEAFVLLICFTKAPSANFGVNTLNIHTAVQGIK